MHRTHLTTLPTFIALLGASLLALATPAITHAQSAAELASSLGQEIQTGQASESGTSVEWGTAVGVVNQPMEAVMGVVQDYANYSQFMPHFRTSRVIAQRGTDAMIYLEVGIIRNTATLWGQLRLRERPARGRSRVVEARLVQGNMDEFRARWELTPVDATHTLVRFQILVAPDLPLPSSIFTHENVKAARKTLRALRRRLVAIG
ncbi:MAG: hypothetical protein GXP55_11435 [Deltaproteobacteria bacterium]|nr:hypothetical protein [Deltaproteobacteria bacterium]